MIRVIHRNFTQSNLTEREWDGHFAFIHKAEWKDSKAVYVNGKPLKPYYIFKNGDVVEVLHRPREIFTSIGAMIAVVTGIGVASGTAGLTALGIGAVVGVAALATGAAMMFTSGRAGGVSASTSSKEYSSTSQPELKGSQNSISDGIVPILFGKCQQTPNYGQLPYRLVQDGSSTNKYRQYFIPNYNNVLYSNFKLGETSVNDYSIDYLDIAQYSGVSTFKGFENCKTETSDEELSYNADEAVNQSSTYYYNETVTANSLLIGYKINFENVDLSNFAQKSFKVVATVQRSVDGVLVNFELEDTFDVSAADVTQSGDDYYYNGSTTFSNGGSVLLNNLVSVQIAPTVQTRGNTTETENELNVVLESETVTAGAFTVTETLNTSINYYLGTMSEVINTSPDDTIEIDVILSFPQGLYKLNPANGNRQVRKSVIEIMYKSEDDVTWSPIDSANALYIRDVDGVKQPLTSSTTTVDGAKVTVQSPDDLNVSDQLFFRPIGFELNKGKYTVRVRSADFAQKTNYDIGYPHVAEIQFRVDGDIVNSEILPKVNQIAFEATAYKGLSGTLKKFNYIGEAVIPVWDGTNWNTSAKTTNPAAIIRYLLTNDLANPRAIDTSFIDNASLVKYYNWCETKGYKASGIITDEVKTLDVIDTILKNSQAAMIPLLNGKHTFAIDGESKTPKGLFNLHNSWDFTWTPQVGRLTEAIRATYIDNSDYTEQELTVYWYDNDVHTSPKVGTSDSDYFLVKKEIQYCNDRTSVLNAISYELKVIQTMRDYFEFKCNLEAVNMTLLDRIYISNSANMQNESTGLIKSVIVENGQMTGFKLYAPVEIAENSQIIIRSLDYDNQAPLISIYDVINSGLTNTVKITPTTLNAQIRGCGEITGLQDSWYYDGDLFSIGQSTIYDCVITDIRYEEDCTATITARNYIND